MQYFQPPPQLERPGDSGNAGMGNDLVDALSGLVHHMRALEQSRRRAEQCFADYAAHSIKVILSDSKYDKECNVGNLETKLQAMQTLLGEVEVEKSRSNHLFATVDSHLKMIARRTGTGTGTVTAAPEPASPANNPGSQGAINDRNSNFSGAPFMGVNRTVRYPTPDKSLYQNYVRKKPVDIKPIPEHTVAYAFSERGYPNETFSVDKVSSVLASKYASTNSCPVSSQHSEIAVKTAKPKQTKERMSLTSLSDLSPRTLFQILLALEEEYDSLERERLDCLALRESTLTSHQVTRKLDDREKAIRKQLDRKAIQVDRVLKVLEPKFQAQTGKVAVHSENSSLIPNSSNYTSKLSAIAKFSKKVGQNQNKEGLDENPGSDSMSGRKSGVEAQGDTSADGCSPMGRSNSDLTSAASKANKVLKRRVVARDKINFERYHNVKLLREMKEFNRFLKSTGTF